MKFDLLVNDHIKSKTVRIVDEEGKQKGVFVLREIIRQAQADGLDVVQVSHGDLPVCRIIDAGKYVFERKKAMREQAKRQRELTVDVKEIQLRPVTDTNDVMVKSRKASEFLQEGDKVKVVVRFKGRERQHKAAGHKIIAEFLEVLGEHKLEREVVDNGRDLQLIISPVKTKADVLKTRHPVNIS